MVISSINAPSKIIALSHFYSVTKCQKLKYSIQLLKIQFETGYFYSFFHNMIHVYVLQKLNKTQISFTTLVLYRSCLSKMPCKIFCHPCLVPVMADAYNCTEKLTAVKVSPVNKP